MAKSSVVPESVTKEIAKNLYRYQNFKGSVIPSKVESSFYGSSTLIGMHSMLRKYLATGEKDLMRASQVFYDSIDEAVNNHVSILRPSQEQEARPYKAKERKEKSPVKVVKTKTVSRVSNPDKINISADTMKKLSNMNTYIALQLEDSFMTFKNEDEMNGFIKACTQMGKSSDDFRKVRITVKSL